MCAFKRKLTVALAIALVFCATLGSVSSVYSEELSNGESVERGDSFFTGGEISGSARLRYENAIDDVADDASATTLRSALSLQSGPVANNRSFSALVELEGVFALGRTDYSDGERDRGTVLIADPATIELNQFYLSYESLRGWQAKLGRQSISFGDERFVGAVSFRQNHQSFDALSLSHNKSEYWSTNYVYVANVNRIFGDGADNRPAGMLGDHEQNTHLFNSVYKGFSAGELEAYAYLINNKDLQRVSSDTIGLRFHGRVRPQRIAYLYTLEYARQRSDDDNPKNYSTDYWRVSGGLSYKRFSLKLTQERLGSDNNAGFVTPFATLHKFQGWADKFAALTPDEGLVNNFVTLAGRWPGFRYRIQYHDFNTVIGSRGVGREIGVHVQRRFKQNYFVEVKYADYQARAGGLQTRGFGSDTRRLFLTLSGRFGD